MENIEEQIRKKKAEISRIKSLMADAVALTKNDRKILIRKLLYDFSIEEITDLLMDKA